MSKYIRQKTAKRISELMDERGISHLINYASGDHITSIIYWITDEHGGVEEHLLTSKSLICEMDWLDLPVI